MRMKIGAALPEGYEPDHGDLSAASATLIAHALHPLFAESLPDEAARANVQAVVTELAYLLDEGAIEMGGRTYRPRLAFVDDAGQVLPGAAQMTGFSEMVDAPFAIDPAARVTFEAPEYEEE